MRSTTLTTLLLPLILLSSVLAVPTPTGQNNNANGGALDVRSPEYGYDCGPQINLLECDFEDDGKADATRLPDNTVLTPN